VDPRRFHDLSLIQQWMQAAIMHPGGVADGMSSPQAREYLDVDVAEIERVITRSRAMSAVDRLQVYGNAYFARLIECLREGFPVVRHALGDDAFDAFAVGYLQNHPSRTYTLTQLGSDFPKYLAETAPSNEEMPESWFDFAVELARFEQAVGEVFDGPGSEGQSPLNVQELLALPQERLLEVRLECAPSLRLIRLECPVHRYYDAVRRELDAIPPGPEEIHLALVRRRYVVRHHELSKTGYELLARLADGESLGVALAVVIADGNVSPGSISSDLRSWFQEWTVGAFFLRALVPEVPD